MDIIEKVESSRVSSDLVLVIYCGIKENNSIDQCIISLCDNPQVFRNRNVRI